MNNNGLKLLLKSHFIQKCCLLLFRTVECLSVPVQNDVRDEAVFHISCSKRPFFPPALTGNLILRGGATGSICDTSSLEAQSWSNIQHTQRWCVKYAASSAHALRMDFTVKQETPLCPAAQLVKWKWSAYIVKFLMRYNMHVWRESLKLRQGTSNWLWNSLNLILILLYCLCKQKRPSGRKLAIYL